MYTLSWTVCARVHVHVCFSSSYPIRRGVCGYQAWGFSTSSWWRTWGCHSKRRGFYTVWAGSPLTPPFWWGCDCPGAAAHTCAGITSPQAGALRVNLSPLMDRYWLIGDRKRLINTSYSFIVFIDIVLLCHVIKHRHANIILTCWTRGRKECDHVPCS